MSTELENKDLTSNDAKPMLCDVTLRFILSDCEKRLKILGERKQTNATLGRINEIQMIVCHLQQRILDNIT